MIVGVEKPAPNRFARLERGYALTTKKERRIHRNTSSKNQDTFACFEPTSRPVTMIRGLGTVLFVRQRRARFSRRANGEIRLPSGLRDSVAALRRRRNRGLFPFSFKAYMEIRVPLPCLYFPAHSHSLPAPSPGHGRPPSRIAPDFAETPPFGSLRSFCTVK